MPDGPDLAQTWRASRPPAGLLHLDSAAAGRSSRAVLRAVAGHAALEAERGGYVAEVLAATTVERARADLASLLGVAADGVALTHSASSALDALLAVWPLPDGATVAVAPSEWGPNLAAFASRGLPARELEVTPDGRVDLPALEARLADAPPGLVHLVQCASHRALAQPVAAAARLCRDAGVPLWVDAAQALGVVDTATGADAVYATSRKWLAGPRGVGVLGIATRWHDRLRVDPLLRRRPAPGPVTPVRLLEPAEAHVAGRLGLALAVTEHLALGPARVHAALSEVGRRTRARLADLPGWEVVDPPDAPGPMTALRPTGGADPSTVRAVLLEQGVLVTASVPARAPREMTGALLRVSPHVDVSDDELGRLRRALQGPSSPAR